MRENADGELRGNLSGKKKKKNMRNRLFCQPFLFRFFNRPLVTEESDSYTRKEEAARRDENIFVIWEYD